MNVLSSDIVFACGMWAGTSSEVSLAIQAKKRIILVGTDEITNAFYQKLDVENISIAADFRQAVLFFR